MRGQTVCRASLSADPTIAARYANCQPFNLLATGDAKGVLAVGQQVNSKGYPYVVAVHPEDCIGCAVCGRMCPDAAIEVYK